MIGRVVEIATDGARLERLRGLMTVSVNGVESGRVPLDDISVLLCRARGITYSNNLLVELAERGASVVLCNSSHLPVAWIWPLEGHHVQAMHMRAQIDAPRPLCKRLWQTVVRSKIAAQKAVLQRMHRPSDGFDQLFRKVRSGDPANVGAQAARRYWPRLLGEDFRRDRFGAAPNGLLNYGYTVLRAAVARSVVAAGLHPSIGIHHSHRGNSMCLVDDLMEPFRPMVDYAVAALVDEGTLDVTSDAKRTLAGVLVADMSTDEGTTPLQTCLDRTAQSLARAYQTREAQISLPREPLPLELAPV